MVQGTQVQYVRLKRESAMRFGNAAVFISTLLLSSGSSACSSEQATPAPPLTLTPHLRIGSADSAPYLLTGVPALAVGRDRSIYVLQPKEALVRIFDSTGVFVRSFGRRGQGPGEFRAMGGLGRIGDTVWVRDAANSRISLFRSDGTFIESAVRRVPPPDSFYIATAPSGLLVDGRTLVSFAWSTSKAGMTTHSFAARVDSTGSILDTLVREPVQRTELTVITERTRGGGPQPFSDASLLAVARGGMEMVIVDRTAAERSGGATFGITRVDAASGRRSAARYPYSPTPLRRETVDSTLGRMVENDFKSDFGEKAYGTPAAALENYRKGVYAPAFLPPISRLVAGGDGTVWVQRWKSDRWLVIGPGGRLMGEAVLPPRVSILAANRDYVWGVELDDVDVPYIVTYRVTGG